LDFCVERLYQQGWASTYQRLPSFSPPTGASWCLGVVGTVTSDRLVRIDTAFTPLEVDMLRHYSVAMLQL